MPVISLPSQAMGPFGMPMKPGNGSGGGAVLNPLDWSLSNEQQRLASSSQTKNWFGIDVAISGDYMVVGKPGETFAATYPGTAVVYIRSGTSWVFQQTLTPSNSGNGDNFGYSVDIDGDYIVVGSYVGNTDFAYGPKYKGGATIFARSGTTWSEEQRFQDGSYEFYGADVGISGDTVIVGSPGKDALGSNAGAAFTLRRTGVTPGSYWVATASPVIPAADQTGIVECNFGHSVAINGDYAAVSAMQHPYDSGTGAGPGAVWIYVRTGNSWNFQAKLVGTDAVNNDGFGYDLDFAGNDTLICGSNNLSSNGYAYVYERSGTTWSETKLTASDGSYGDWFGRDVAINTVTGYSPTAMVGAPREGTGGSVYIFTKVSGTWTQQEKLIQSSVQSGAEFGISVDIDGDYFASGAWKENGYLVDDGATYVFYRGADSSGAGAGGGAALGWISTISDELQGYGYTDVRINSLAVDSNDNIIAGGSADNYQIVIRIKPDGTVDNAVSFGVSGATNQNRAIAVDSNDNIFTGGYAKDMWNKTDGHVMKLSSSLTKTWDNFFGEGYDDEHYDITTSGTDAYAVGEAKSFALNWGSDPKGYIVKYNSSGGEWKTMPTSVADRNRPRGVSSDGNDVWMIGCEANNPVYIVNFSSNMSLRWSKLWGTNPQEETGMDIDCNPALLTQSAACMFEGGKIKVLKLTAQTLDWQVQWEKASTDHGTANPGFNWSQGLAVKLLSTGSVALLALGSMFQTTQSARKSFYIIVFDSSGNVTVEKEFRLTNSTHYLGLNAGNQKALVETAAGKIVTAMSYYTGSDWENGVFNIDPTDTTTAINGTHGDWTISEITDSTSATSSSNYISGSATLDSNMSMYFKTGTQNYANGYNVSSATVVEGTQTTLVSPEAGDNTGVSHDFGGGVMLSWSVQDDNVAQSERILTNATLAAQAQAGDIVVVENSTIQAYNTYNNLGWQLRDSGNLIFVVKAVSGNDLTILYAQEMIYRAQSTATVLNRDFKDHFDNTVNLGSVPADATLGYSYDFSANGTTASQRWLGGTATLYRYFQSDVESANDTSGGNSNYQVPLPDVTGRFVILGVPNPAFNDFTSDSTFQVPANVSSISAVCIGGGGGGGGSANVPGGGGGSGGGLSYRNNISVTAGETLTITVGSYGSGAAVPSDPPGGNATGDSGGDTKILRGSTVLLEALGGAGGYGFSYSAATGGAGGSNVDAGYGGTNGGPGGSRTGQGAGGGKAGDYTTAPSSSESAGVGGEGRSVVSESTSGSPDPDYSNRGGVYGGGGAGGRSFGWRGGAGAVRIRFDGKGYPTP